MASWSKDPSTQCGAVVVRPDQTISSFGFNGFPQRMNDTQERYEDRSFKYPHIIHSEWNALLSSQDATLEGCQVYAWPMPPCHECTNFLIQKKISGIVCPSPEVDKLERWQSSFEHSRQIAKQTGLNYKEVFFLDDKIDNFVSEHKWHGRFVNLAKEICSWSKDTVAPRGTVLVRKDKTICSLGFTGFPQGVDDTPLSSRDESKIKMSLIPAELNAILFSRDKEHDNVTCYSWPNKPSLRSIVHLAHENILHFVFPKTGPHDDDKLIAEFLSEVGGTITEI